MLTTTLAKKFITCFIAALTTAALLLVLGNSGTLAWFPPILVFSLIAISFALALMFPLAWHRRETNQRGDSTRMYAGVYGVIRYTLAFNLATFGWKKILHLQFVVPAEIASLPMNRQSGEWLTWYYFGHSPAFGVIIALVQIGGAFLLLFRKTQLLGATILFTFMLNLTLINIFYQMNAGALVQSFIITTGICFLLLSDYKKLIALFFHSTPSIPGISMNLFTKNWIRASALLLSLLFTAYLKWLMK